jgi:hypothetical protein
VADFDADEFSLRPSLPLASPLSDGGSGGAEDGRAGGVAGAERGAWRGGRGGGRREGGAREEEWTERIRMQEAGTGGGDGGWLDSKLGAVKEDRLAELRQEVSAKKREEAVVQNEIAREFCATADYQKDLGRERGVDIGRERGSRKDLGRERGVGEGGGERRQGRGMGDEQEREQGGGRGGRGRGAESAEEEDELMGLDSEMLALQRSLERAARWLG